MGEIYYERILLALMLPMNSTTPWNSVETLEKIGQNIIWRNMIKNLSFEKKIKNIITLLVNATMSMMKLSKVFIFCLANDCTSLSRHSKYLSCVSQWGELFINEYSKMKKMHTYLIMWIWKCSSINNFTSLFVECSSQ